MLSIFWGRTPVKAASLLVTTAVIVSLLGINVSALGLVELDGSAVSLLAEMLVLIMALIFGFAGIFHVIERRRFATLSTPSADRRTAAGVGASAP